MSNMSYCRFENTASDLDDCLKHIHDDEKSMSESEVRARLDLIKTCKEIVSEAGEGEDA